MIAQRDYLDTLKACEDAGGVDLVATGVAVPAKLRIVGCKVFVLEKQLAPAVVNAQ